MNGNMQIIFDFKNSKEYISSYEFEKVNIKIKNVLPKQQNLGTFLLDFMNINLNDSIDLTLFVNNYLFVYLLTLYNNTILKDINNYYIELKKINCKILMIDSMKIIL